MFKHEGLCVLEYASLNDVVTKYFIFNPTPLPSMSASYCRRKSWNHSNLEKLWRVHLIDQSRNLGLFQPQILTLNDFWSERVFKYSVNVKYQSMINILMERYKKYNFRENSVDPPMHNIFSTLLMFVSKSKLPRCKKIDENWIVSFFKLYK